MSFCAENVLENLPELDFVIQGEGEETVKEISQKFFVNKTKTEFFESLKDVKQAITAKQVDIIPNEIIEDYLATRRRNFEINKF